MAGQPLLGAMEVNAGKHERSASAGAWSRGFSAHQRIAVQGQAPHKHHVIIGQSIIVVLRYALGNSNTLIHIQDVAPVVGTRPLPRTKVRIECVMTPVERLQSSPERTRMKAGRVCRRMGVYLAGKVLIGCLPLDELGATIFSTG